jgi:hypothetical protein
MNERMAGDGWKTE